MVMLVGTEWYFLGVGLVLWVLVVERRIDPHRRGKYRDLSLLLRFEMLPSVLLVLNFRASGFLPNKLDQRRTQLGTSVRLLLLMI